MTQMLSRRQHVSSPYAGIMPRPNKSHTNIIFKNYISLGIGALFCLACIKFLFMEPISLQEIHGFQNKTMVEFQTSEGNFVLELFPDNAPKTVANFLNLVSSGFYTGNKAGFYRHESDFLVQGGGFIHDNIPPQNLVPVEYRLPSTERTVVLARKANEFSGNSEFAIMLADNSLINAPKEGDPGFTTFGRVFEGWNTILKVSSKLPNGFLSKTNVKKAVNFDNVNLVSREVATDPKLKKTLEIIKDHIATDYRVVVFSKSTCPYCRKVKTLLTSLGASFDVIELDSLNDGPLYQDALEYLTGRRTVPNVFINSQSIGGCDDTEALQNNGRLQTMLQDSGALAMSLTRNLIRENPCVIFSKSTCPFCLKAKEALSSLNAKALTVELDQRPDGKAIQSALSDITGQKTVPNIFIKGKSIGGGDNTVRLKENGELLILLQQAEAVLANQ